MATTKSTDRQAREARDRLRRYQARQVVYEHGRRRRTRDNIIAIAGVLSVAVLVAGAQLFYFNGGPGTPPPAPTAAPTATADSRNVGDVPDPSVAEGRTWTGSLTLNEVPLEISLDGALAPQAVASFVTSAQDGYYLDKTCHRLVSSPTAGLIQCGSFNGTGAPDPSYSFGPVENAAVGGVYRAGTIAMARGGGDAYSNGRQFFIVFADAALPDDAVGGYTVVGTVTSGLDQLAAQIGYGGVIPGPDGDTDGAPVVATSITSLTVQ